MSMFGKIVLVTGANSGIGFETAHALAQQGADVVMVCRNPFRGAVAQRAVAQAALGPDPTLVIADLQSQASIRKLAAEVRSRFPRLDVLVNNAGAVFTKRELSVDGIEKTLAVNHLAPFLLTHLLLDRLRASPAGRIVTVSSDVYSSRLAFDNLQSEKGHNFFSAYSRTKLANILFTYELARRLKGTSITANCLSPGPSKTHFGDNLQGLAALFPLVMKRIPFLFATPEVGARTSIHLASSPDVAGVTGKFFMKCREVVTKPVTHDRDLAMRLWKVSEKLCGTSLDTPSSLMTEESAGWEGSRQAIHVRGAHAQN